MTILTDEQIASFVFQSDYLGEQKTMGHKNAAITINKLISSHRAQASLIEELEKRVKELETQISSHLSYWTRMRLGTKNDR